MPTTADLVAKYGKYEGEGLEIGVGLGDTSVMMLQRLMPKKMTLVDCYEQQPWETYPDDFNVPKNIQDVRMQSALARIMEYAEGTGTVVDFHRMMSWQWAEKNRGIKFDFIFLDGNHSYKAVKSDLAVIWDMIKPRGVIFCHDYCRGMAYYGVIEAVDEFVADRPDAELAEISNEKFPVAVILKVE